MPPQNIDMSLIQEAIARRRQGGAMPAAQQVTQPVGVNPATNGLPTPNSQSQQVPPGATGRDMPAPSPNRQQGIGMAPLDGDAKEMARALAVRLIQPGQEQNKQLLQKLVQVL